MADGKITRAELAEEIRLLREEVAALRAERAAHQCGCHHVVWQMYPALPVAPALPGYPPFQVTCDSPVLTVGAGTSVAAGAPQVQFLALGN